MRYCLNRFAEKDVAKVIHGETGPELITEAVSAMGKRGSVLDGKAYFPVPWWDYRRLFFDEHLALEGCFTVRFWNAMIESEKLEKDGRFSGPKRFRANEAPVSLAACPQQKKGAPSSRTARLFKCLSG